MENAKDLDRCLSYLRVDKTIQYGYHNVLCGLPHYNEEIQDQLNTLVHRSLQDKISMISMIS